MILIYIVMIVLFIVVIIDYKNGYDELDKKVNSLSEDNQSLQSEIEYLNEKIKDNPREDDISILADGIQENGQRIVDLNVGVNKLYSKVEGLEVNNAGRSQKNM